MTQPPRPPGGFYLPPAPPTVIKPVSRWVWIGAAVAVAAFVAVAAEGVSLINSFVAQGRAADTVVQTLHHEMKDADAAAIYAAADPGYRKDEGVGGFNDVFDYVHARIGAPLSTTRTDTNVSTNPGTGTIMTLEYYTVFEHGTGKEYIKLHKSSGVYRLYSYYIDSPELRQDDNTAEPKVEIKINPPPR